MSSAVLHSLQQETAEKEKSLLVQTYDRLPVLLDRGEGVYLYDSEGKRYLDFLSGIGVNALGHAHPEIRRVIEEQAGKLLHTSNLFYHHYQSRVAEKLTAISGLDRAFFCNSGTEAWETALKLARAYGKHLAPKGSKPKTKFLVMVIEQIRRMKQFAGLFFNRLANLRVCVAQRVHTNSTQEIEVALPFIVVQVDALPALQENRQAVVCLYQQRLFFFGSLLLQRMQYG